VHAKFIVLGSVKKPAEGVWLHLSQQPPVCAKMTDDRGTIWPRQLVSIYAPRGIRHNASSASVASHVPQNEVTDLGQLGHDCEPDTM